ncbi:MAG: phage tail protein [Treponema sp.]
MRIFDEKKELDIPKWITASSSASTIQTQAVRLNDRHGEYPTGKEQYSSKTFQCSGTISTDSACAVEKERSRLLSLLSGKDLIVYRDDDDTIFYRCRLTGQIQITYYNGENLHKVFTISFTLKAFDPFGYGQRKIETIAGGRRDISIVTEGNLFTVPEIAIGDIEKVSGLLVHCNGTELKISREIAIPHGKTLLYKDGTLFLDGEDYTRLLTLSSIIHPLYFIAGHNTVSIYVPTGTVTVAFNGRYL